MVAGWWVLASPLVVQSRLLMLRAIAVVVLVTARASSRSLRRGLSCLRRLIPLLLLLLLLWLLLASRLLSLLSPGGATPLQVLDIRLSLLLRLSSLLLRHERGNHGRAQERVHASPALPMRRRLLLRLALGSFSGNHRCNRILGLRLLLGQLHRDHQVVFVGDSTSVARVEIRHLVRSPARGGASSTASRSLVHLVLIIRCLVATAGIHQQRAHRRDRDTAQHDDDQHDGSVPEGLGHRFLDQGIGGGIRWGGRG